MGKGQYLRIRPAGKLQGTVMLPGDKSLSHRALLLAALGEGESVIDNCLHAGVTQAMMECLRNLGVQIRVNEAPGGQPTGSAAVVVGGRGLRGLNEPEQPLYCGGSATTMRLMSGILAGQPVRSTLDGNARLRERPMDRIVEPLRAKGAVIRTTAGNAPLTFFPAELKSSSHVLPTATAQVTSELLLPARYADGPTTVSEPHGSRDHTERMLRNLGVRVEERLDRAGRHVVRILEGISRLPRMHMRLPSDPSSAAFIIVAGLIVPGSDSAVPGV